MKAYLFPGQASQFPGMGKDLFEHSDLARDLFQFANEVLGYEITEVMFEGSEEDLKETKITQPAVFLYTYIKSRMLGERFKPAAVAGHSLGEFTALTAARGLSFEDGLKLVHIRAEAMQAACESNPGTMAAIVGLEDSIIEQTCDEITELVVPANYNCPGQLVISGSNEGVEKAVDVLTERGARRAIVLPVGGAFHSELMSPAMDDLAGAVSKADFKKPVCPLYQNFSARATQDVDEIRDGLVKQLTAPVRWSQSMNQMIADGISDYAEVGGRVLTGFMRRIDRKMPIESI